jgi:hypothetical protein
MGCLRHLIWLSDVKNSPKCRTGLFTRHLQDYRRQLQRTSNDTSSRKPLAANVIPSQPPQFLVSAQLIEESGNPAIFYCFYASVEALSKVRHGTPATGSTDGPFVWTGFKPIFIMTKRTDSTSDWTVWDGVRNGFNPADDILRANTTAAEASNFNTDFTSNGWEIKGRWCKPKCLWWHLHLHGIRRTPLWRRRRCPCYGSIGGLQCGIITVK